MKPVWKLTTTRPGATSSWVNIGTASSTIGATAMQQSVAYGAHFLSESPCYVGGLTREQKRDGTRREDRPVGGSETKPHEAPGKPK